MVGQGHVVSGLDADLVGREIGEERNLLLTPEEAFGPRRGELVETVSVKRFKEKPRPGQRVQLDNRVGTIQSVVGGRARVDYNQPLAGIAVTYNYKVEEVISDKKKKVDALMEVYYGEPLAWSQKEDLIDIEVPYRLTFDQRWMLSKKNLADALLEMDGVGKVRLVETFTPPSEDGEKAKDEEKASSGATAKKEPEKTGK